jgi:ABC-type uncharacterized transport system permease subunit
MNTSLAPSAAVLGGAVAVYLIGAVLLAANLFLRRTGVLVSGRVFASVGALLHMTAIGLRCAELHQAPFTTPAESLSLLAWVVVLVYLGTELLWRLSAAGPFALGLSFLLVLLGGVLGRNEPAVAANPLLAENAISLHIIATITAIGAFALAFCCAALYLVAYRILKSKHGLAWMKRLPPLGTVERAAFTLVAIGFPLLTLGILSGLVRAAGGGMTTGWQTDVKTLLAYGVWAIYGAYLVARLSLRWSPVRTAYVLLVGLALCLLLFFVPSGSHRFG